MQCGFERGFTLADFGGGGGQRQARQVRVALGVCPDFPAGGHKRALLREAHDVGARLDRVGGQVPLVVTHLGIAQQVKHTPVAVLLHQGQQVGVVIEVAVVEREDDWFGWKCSEWPLTAGVFQVLGEGDGRQVSLFEVSQVLGKVFLRDVNLVFGGQRRIRDFVVHQHRNVADARLLHARRLVGFEHARGHRI